MNAPLAQVVEQRTVNPCVAGSNPAGGAKTVSFYLQSFFCTKSKAKILSSIKKSFQHKLKTACTESFYFSLEITINYVRLADREHFRHLLQDYYLYLQLNTTPKYKRQLLLPLKQKECVSLKILPAEKKCIKFA